MTELDLRQKYVSAAKSFLGAKESDGSHRRIIDIYNSIVPLPVGYRMTYGDPWCAAFVSAVAWKLGLTHIIYPECHCDRMIELYSKKGRWIEDDSYRPQIGDLIMYDWDDNGYGDCTGGADHVGIIVDAGTTQMTVIEGNKSDSVAYRYFYYDARYIRGYCVPDYALVADSYNETSNPVEVPTGEPAPSNETVKVPAGTYTSPAKDVTPQPIDSSLPSPDVNIKYGDAGDGVKKMQSMLIALGYDCGKCGADGEYGLGTYYALTKFQRNKGLKADGIYGIMTQNKLTECYNAFMGVDKVTITAEAPASYYSGLNINYDGLDELYQGSSGWIPRVGGTCIFVGDRHYTGSNSMKYSMCLKGRARITNINDGALHPYHLVKIAGGGSTVYGWVNREDIREL